MAFSLVKMYTLILWAEDNHYVIEFETINRFQNDIYGYYVWYKMQVCIKPTPFQ